jgi:hypothetical protein
MGHRALDPPLFPGLHVEERIPSQQRPTDLLDALHFLILIVFP